MLISSYCQSSFFNIINPHSLTHSQLILKTINFLKLTLTSIDLVELPLYWITCLIQLVLCPLFHCLSFSVVLNNSIVLLCNKL
ncbi:hypothetical protein PGT21_015386 [Puccinia graminis f. sp. tritici]|uniref:Uncharacterized protein n=1 Tax=Puccinia graminis f. sp. tritici TaxID=56615 RepID=A0A5B0P8X3_PUCGR|nr:hypothetical protein PGT21_015386 [Puccinia graminis f. sp. tritici]